MNKGRTDVIEPVTVAQLTWRGAAASTIAERAKVQGALLAPVSGIGVAQDALGLRFVTSAPDANWQEKLAGVRQVAHFATALAAQQEDVVLHWEFSSVELKGAELDEMKDLWEKQGFPPTLHLISFAASSNSEDAMDGFVSKGLDYFFGLEIEIWPHHSGSQKSAFRLATRLANDILANGLPQVPSVHADPFDAERQIELHYRSAGRVASGPILEIISSEIDQTT